MIEHVLQNLDKTELSTAQNLVAEGLKLEDARGRIKWTPFFEPTNRKIEAAVVDEIGELLGTVSFPWDRRHPSQSHSQTAEFEGFGLDENVRVRLEGANLVPFFKRAGLHWDDYYADSDAPRAHIFL